jgi:hypothetical protein
MIKQFELFHGAVLAKLMRSDKPITLRLIETRNDAWSIYTINNEIELFIKISKVPNELIREVNGYSWQFQFTSEQIVQLKSLKKSRNIAIALVCGHQSVSENMQIAFLNPELVDELFDFSTDNSQSLTVKFIPNKQLRVIRNYKIEKFIPQNALEKWVVPGN